MQLHPDDGSSGQGRQSIPQRTFSNRPAQTVRTQLLQTRSVPPQAPVSMLESSVSVRYLETSPIQVRGLVSGMSYTFSAEQPVQQVDAKDASSLLNTRFFRRVS